MLAELLKILLVVMKKLVRVQQLEKLKTFHKKILLKLILLSIKILQINLKKMIEFNTLNLNLSKQNSFA